MALLTGGTVAMMTVKSGSKRMRRAGVPLIVLEPPEIFAVGEWILAKIDKVRTVQLSTCLND